MEQASGVWIWKPQIHNYLEIPGGSTKVIHWASYSGMSFLISFVHRKVGTVDENGGNDQAIVVLAESSTSFRLALVCATLQRWPPFELSELGLEFALFLDTGIQGNKESTAPERKTGWKAKCIHNH